MGYWSLVVPEATKNYIANPSFELGLAGYTNFATGTAAGTRTRTLAWQKRDAYSYRIVKSSGGATDLYGFSINALLPGEFVAGDYCTFSVDVHVISGTVRVRVNVNSGAFATNIDVTTSGRYSVTVGPLTGTITSVEASCYVTTATGEFYADGLQVERKAYATTYCDGTRKGCSWNGKPHASTSSRSAQTHFGGREYNLDTLGYYVSDSPGIGMPPIKHFTLPQALIPGSLLRGYQVSARSLTLVMDNTPVSRADLHSKRKTLINILKPDLTKEFETVLLRYSGANSSKVVELMVAYDTGLEFTTLGNLFNEDVGIRLIAYDPFWYEDGDTAVTLNGLNTIASPVGNVLRRDNGVWSEINAMTGAVYAIAEGRDGTIYFGGSFTNVGDANGDGIVAYDPETGAFTSLGTGIASGGSVFAIAISPKGDVFIGGSFTGVGGVANTARIAKWDISSGVWQSIATAGADNTVSDMVIDQNNVLTITGNFLNVNSVAMSYIARYDISAGTWSAYGTGLSAPGSSLAISPNNLLYVGGDFLTANGVTVNRITYWNGTTFVAMPATGTAGVNGNVAHLLFDKRGTLYLSGAFTQCAGVSGYNRVATWNGISYSTLGSGFSSGTVFTLGLDEAGRIFANVSGGDLQAWNGSVWSVADIMLPDLTALQVMLVSKNGVTYLGHASLIGTSYIAAQTTVNNTGSRSAFPKVVIERIQGTTPCVVQWLRNDTTGDTIYLDYSMLIGEILTLDFSPNARTITSNFFGTVWRGVQQTSQFSSFNLLPGQNQLSLMVFHTSTVEAYIQWQNVHWSIDGVAS